MCDKQQWVQCTSPCCSQRKPKVSGTYVLCLGQDCQLILFLARFWKIWQWEDFTWKWKFELARENYLSWRSLKFTLQTHNSRGYFCCTEQEHRTWNVTERQLFCCLTLFDWEHKWLLGMRNFNTIIVLFFRTYPWIWQWNVQFTVCGSYFWRICQKGKLLATLVWTPLHGEKKDSWKQWSAKSLFWPRMVRGSGLTCNGRWSLYLITFTRCTLVAPWS